MFLTICKQCPYLYLNVKFITNYSLFTLYFSNTRNQIQQVDVIYSVVELLHLFIAIKIYRVHLHNLIKNPTDVV